MNRSFIIPNFTAEATAPRATVDVQALRRIAPAQLHSQCVPSPYAQAELMAHVLTAETAAEPVAVKPSDMLRQTRERWQTLLVGLVLGKITLKVESLRAPDALGFGRMLVTARPDGRYLGVLRTTELGPSASGRDARVVGALDPECLCWAAPRLPDTLWSELDTRVGRKQNDERVALEILYAWRKGLIDKGLYDAMRGPVWMRSLDALLASEPTLPGTVASGLQRLATEVEMVGPAMLWTMRGTEGGRDLTSLYLPVYRPRRERLMHQVLMWPAARGESSGAVEFKAPGAPPSWRVTMVAGSNDATPREQLAAGVGLLARGEGPEMPPDRKLRLQDAPDQVGYKRLVYDPLLATTVAAHETSGLSVSEADMDLCPALFPDTLRLVRPLLVGSKGRSAARYSKNLAQWELPLFAELLLEEVVSTGDLKGPGDELMIALAGPQPRLTLVERVDLAGGRREPAELRALGAALWELFIDEAKLEGVSVTRRAGKAFSLLPTEASLWFDERFLDELRSPDARVSALGEETYAARVWRRRATLQRFARSWADRWKANPTGDARVVGEALGAIAAWCFVQWVARLCSGQSLEGDGGRVSAVVRGAIDLIPNVVSIPVVRDCYPREGGSR